jgi:hypothetical protein
VAMEVRQKVGELSEIVKTINKGLVTVPRLN